jgi:hypothetical protein
VNVNDLRSLALVQIALGRMARDWGAGERIVRRNLETARRAECCDERLLEQIECALSHGPVVFTETFLRQDDLGQLLRSVSPFAGLVTPDERLMVIRTNPLETRAA